MKQITVADAEGEAEYSFSAPAVVQDAAVGGAAAAASPNASAADWFDGDGYDQTDGFGDERGDLTRNVRPKLDSGAHIYLDAVAR